MDGLIQLVADRFARHGIECPEPKTVESRPPAETPLPAKLAEHNYRQSKEPILIP